MEYSWVNYYKEFANILLQYKNNRSDLLQKMQDAYSRTSLDFPKLEKDGSVIDIDPFTVFAHFSKGITDKNKQAILTEYAKEFGVIASVPTDFDGIPSAFLLQSNFFGYQQDRKEEDIDNLWDLYEVAIKYADEGTGREDFCQKFDRVIGQFGIKWNISQGLFWIRPETYLALDSMNRDFILKQNDLQKGIIEQTTNFKKKSSLISGDTYLQFVKLFADTIKNGDYSYKNFIDFSFEAFKASDKKEGKEASIITDNENKNRIWLFAPGEQACKWEDFYKKGIMALGWSETGSLTEFDSKSAIKDKLREVNGNNLPYKNPGNMLWKFCNDIKIGDIIYAKKGMRKIIGRGIVEDDYYYDDTQEYSHIRKVKWDNNEEHIYPTNLNQLTLYEANTEDLDTLKTLYDEDITVSQDNDSSYDSYSESDFLDEVFMSQEDYREIVSVLKNKKNIILQGAPGVGKTFTAKRLAYSIIGKQDKSRVKLIQFHQSYSYEDFIEGFRPDQTGFVPHKGVFYQFCKDAEADDVNNSYYFIIDEINRGNLSKIFGELFVLIEKDKRGAELDLLYSKNKFSVPSNVYIIGMMNTADRSLAMIDYALRRRFSFITLKPGFDSEGFKKMQDKISSKTFNNLIEVIKSLNDFITKDPALGEGFQIGHSYFCLDKDQSCTKEWMKEIVKYDIIPTLEEYWFDAKEKVDDWKIRLNNVFND